MKRIHLMAFLFFATLQFKAMAQKPVLDHIALYVTKLDKAARFYGQTLQLDTIPEPFHDGKHAWFSIGGGLQLHLIEGLEKPSEAPKRNHICFRFTSLAPFLERLRAAGVTWEDLDGKAGGITHRPDGVQQVYFRDPDGYWIEANDVGK